MEPCRLLSQADVNAADRFQIHCDSQPDENRLRKVFDLLWNQTTTITTHLNKLTEDVEESSDKNHNIFMISFEKSFYESCNSLKHQLTNSGLTQT